MDGKIPAPEHVDRRREREAEEEDFHRRILNLKTKLTEKAEECGPDGMEWNRSVVVRIRYKRDIPAANESKPVENGTIPIYPNSGGITPRVKGVTPVHCWSVEILNDPLEVVDVP